MQRKRGVMPGWSIKMVAKARNSFIRLTDETIANSRAPSYAFEGGHWWDMNDFLPLGGRCKGNQTAIAVLPTKKLPEARNSFMVLSRGTRRNFRFPSYVLGRHLGQDMADFLHFSGNFMKYRPWILFCPAKSQSFLKSFSSPFFLDRFPSQRSSSRFFCGTIDHTLSQNGVFRKGSSNCKRKGSYEGFSEERLNFWLKLLDPRSLTITIHVIEGIFLSMPSWSG